MALGVNLTDKFGIYLEPYGEWVDFKVYEANANVGVTYLIKNNLQFDFSFGTGINHEMNYMALGCSWLIGGINE